MRQSQIRPWFIAFGQALLMIALGLPAHGQATIAIDVTEQSVRSSTLQYINGYMKPLDGSTIMYHSIHPDAEDALLVRANTEAPSISWQTDTLPDAYTGDVYHLVWLAGIERIGWGNATTPHQFQLFINGTEAITFTNRKDSTAEHWQINNGKGVELRFDAGLSDKYGDLFGYMYLTVAKALYKSGTPLTLSIRGVDAGSPEWVMVFKHAFNFSPQLRVEPALARNQGERSRLVRMSLDNLRPGRSVRVTIGGKEAVLESLKVGANIFLLPFSASGSTPDVQVSFSLDGKHQQSYSLPVPPVQIRSIYLLPHTHNDIGYTDVQPEVERKQWRYLEEAMAMIRQTRSNPPEARYKWNLEILWPLESWLHNASTEKKEEFLTDVREGSIGLNALLVNPLTGLANAPEMAHYTDFARSMTNLYGIPITTAVIDDIPGFTWGLVPALVQSGVRYFASGPNNGDRIGYIMEELGDKPFWWTSQSGAESVLCWVAGSSYAAFHQNTLAKAGPERLMKLMRKLDDEKYPYSMYFIPYTLGDNHGNDSTLAEYVKEWNEKYISPRLVIATHEQLFHDFEALHGASLPVRTGDLTPYWEDGAASTAYETEVTRYSVDRLLQAEAIWSVRSPAQFPQALADCAWRQVSLWDEHTWGADISVSDPDSSKSTDQWKIKRQYALDADSLSNSLLTQALPHGLDGQNSFDVWNTSSWTRSGLITLTKAQSSAGDQVTDEHGKTLASQRLDNGELAVFVENIPPLSPIQVRVSAGAAKTPSSIVKAEGTTMENNMIVLSVDEHRGSIRSLRLKSTGRELVDQTKGAGLNEYFYVPGTNADSAMHLKNVRVTLIDRGPLVATMRISGDAPGCNNYSSEIRMNAGVERVDIVNSMDKKKIRSKEGVHWGFPFAVPNGQVRYDVASGIVRAESDQMIGSCKNFISAVSWADVSNDAGGITLTTPDVPEIEIGAINAERPWMKTTAPGSTLYSYVMNNYWHTNYKADQEGPATFRYSLYPHDSFSPVSVSRTGFESRQPLIVSAAAAPIEHTGAPFSISPSSVIVSSIRPLEDGHGWLLLLYNPGKKDEEVSFNSVIGKPMTCIKSDASGRHEGPSQTSIELKQSGTAFVVLNSRN